MATADDDSEQSVQQHPKRLRLAEPEPSSDSDNDDDLVAAMAKRSAKAYAPSPPEGSASRAATAAKAVVKLTAGGLFGLGPNAETRAKTFAHELARLRGVYTKVGQVVAAFLTASSPEPGTLHYYLAVELARLQHMVLPMEPSKLIAEMARSWNVTSVLEVLEGPPEILAAASIGQVFRARLRKERGGRTVAIKVQYPGIGKAMKDDLAAIEGVLSLITRAMSFKVSTDIVANEIRHLIGGEIDYAQEMRVQKAFHQFWKGHPSISVPEPIDELCSETVIVQDLGKGIPFSQFVQKNINNPDARLKAAVNLFEFFNESLVVLGLFHADPHPGNVLVRPDGSITMLDYGCVRSSPVPSRDLSRRTLMRALTGDRERLTDEFAAHPAFRNQPAQAVQDTMDILWPVFTVHSEPFNASLDCSNSAAGSVFSAEWLHRCHNSMSPSKMSEVLGPPDMLFKHRLTHGLNCMLVELGPPGTREFWYKVTSRYSAPDSRVPPNFIHAEETKQYPPPHAFIGGSVDNAASTAAAPFGLDITERYAFGQELREQIGSGFTDENAG